MGQLVRLLQRILGRLLHIVRPVQRRAHELQVTLSDTARSLPVPDRVRRSAYRFIPWRPWTQVVALDRLLLGGQNGLSSRQFADAMDDLLWSSTRVIDGPHARLLASARHDELSDETIVASDYFRMATCAVQRTGNFFGATDGSGIVEEARLFLARSASSPAEASTARERPGESAHGSDIRVSAIRGSRLFQVVDGHHRVAAAHARGERDVVVRASWLKVSTPLQDLLSQMSWIGGDRELYQPVEAPELEDSWTTVRACTDRLTKMLDECRRLDIDPATSSYLDVASCYGWFVSHMLDAGFDARGVERDPLAPRLGHQVYGLDPSRISVVDDAAAYLAQTDDRFDVTSCLSLLHHFALGRGSIDATTLVRHLDRVTGRVLFIDTGQSHEEWLSRRLIGWSTEETRSFLLRETTFDEVIDLGPDADAVGAYQLNYGRHLFACVRH